MNKYIAILSVAVGIGVFAEAVNIATPRPILRTTEDSVIRAEYDAPIASFMGTLPKSKGAAHTSRTINRASDSAKVDGPIFGQFSTAKAMSYHAIGIHNSKVPNPRQVVGDITVH